jgi:hypothetical protein
MERMYYHTQIKQIAMIPEECQLCEDSTTLLWDRYNNSIRDPSNRSNAHQILCIRHSNRERWDYNRLEIRYLQV